MITVYFSDDEVLLCLVEEEEECLLEWFAPDGDRNITDFNRIRVSGGVSIQMGFDIVAGRQLRSAD